MEKTGKQIRLEQAQEAVFSYMKHFLDLEEQYIIAEFLEAHKICVTKDETGDVVYIIKVASESATFLDRCRKVTRERWSNYDK